jgi:hypothetical protein
MSAAIGPKVFALPGTELVAMMQANFESLKQVVADIDDAVTAEDEPNTKASLERWRAKFATDAVQTQILLAHVKPDEVHWMTGTEMIGVFRTFRMVSVNVRYLRLNPPPPDGEYAEHRLAATAAAVPRAAGNPQGVSHIWMPGVESSGRG